MARVRAPVLAGAMLLTSATSFGEASTSERVDRLDEVVVTARKREENLQVVPISIAVYRADDLTAQSVQQLSELGQVTPNFHYGQKAQSGSSAGQLYIRGVGQQDTQAAFNPGVGVYVDGVYLGRPQADDLDMASVERLEVLYGPQGTLFGKNTNGGAINIVTARPDPTAQEIGGTVEVQGGHSDRFATVANINVPIAANSLAMRVSVARRKQDGYSRRVDGEDQANEDRASGRVELLWKPHESFEALLNLDGTTFDERSAAYKLVGVRAASPIPVLYASLTPFRYDDRWVTSSDYLSQGTGPNKNSGDTSGASLTMTWTRPWGTVKSISAYRHLRVESEFDPDASPLTILDVFNNVGQSQVSQELQSAGSSFDGRLSWVAGLYYFDEIARDEQPAVVAQELLYGAANFDPRLYIENRNYAAYGQASWQLTDKLKITAGGRAGNDWTEVNRIVVGYPTPDVQQPFISRSASWSSFLPRASLEYQWTNDVMVYVSAAEGSKSGGFNGRAGTSAEFNRFEPEKVWSYESGVRSDWWDERLRLNAAAFYSVYSDFQILVNRSVTDPVTGNPVPFSFVGNMPRAVIKGGELALTAVPMAGLEVSAGLGIADGDYRTVVSGAPVTTRSEFVNTPKVTVTTAVEYAAPVGSTARLAARVDYIHKSTIQYDSGNSPLVAQDPYGLLNARLTLTFRSGDISLFLFGTNLTNAHYAVGGIDDGPGGSLGEVIKLMGPPRQWGVGGEYRF